MNTLLLSEGSLLNLKSTTLPLGKFIKIQPQSPAFLSIHDPKAVLEMSLRNFSALTTGDIIQISYNSQIYEIAVLEVKAHGTSTSEITAVCVIETDIEVDFATPVGYIEPDRSTQVSSATSSRPASRMTGTGTPGLPNETVSIHGGMAARLDYHALVSAPDTQSESAFARGGQSLRGKQSVSSPLATLSVSQGERAVLSSVRTTKSFLEGGPVPRPFKVGFGCIFVGYPVVPVKKEGDEDEETSENFKGQGVRLKDAAKTKRKKKDKNASGSNPADAIQID